MTLGTAARGSGLSPYEHAGQSLRLYPCGSPDRCPCPGEPRGSREAMQVDVIVDRCVGIDLSKADAKVCLRTPGGRRDQQVRTYSTMTAGLHALADWLVCEQVELVVIEATSSYWFSIYEVLEDRGLSVQIVNPRQFKNTPGRRKSDVIDCVWLCKLAECGLLSPSFVPPKDIRRLRQLTRYRSALITARGSESQRLEKL